MKEGVGIKELASEHHDVFCLTSNLKDLIVAKANLVSGAFFVGLGGYPAVGKTTTALRLAQLLGEASVLQTDCFMLDRRERETKTFIWRRSRGS